MSAGTANRGRNISKDQKEILISIMERDIALACDRFDGIDGKYKIKESWQRAAIRLNSIGEAQKDAEKWKRAWNDMKKYVRNQWSALTEYDNRTGLGLERNARKPSELNTLDQRILDIITPESCAGTSNDEGGITNPTTSSQHNISSNAIRSNSSAALDLELDRSVTTPQPNISSRRSTRVTSDLLATASIPPRSKRIRGSAYTRDVILKESNKIERDKANALKRIASALEDSTKIKERKAAAMETRNELLDKIFLSRNNNNNIESRQQIGPMAEDDFIEILEDEFQ